MLSFISTQVLHQGAMIFANATDARMTNGATFSQTCTLAVGVDRDCYFFASPVDFATIWHCNNDVPLWIKGVRSGSP